MDGLTTHSTPAKRARIFAIANQKGGVGKTTTTINLGTAIAAAGEKVLLIDLDPQGNASTGLGIGRKARADGTYTLLIGAAGPRDIAMPTIVPGLLLIPADDDLVGAEIELVSHTRREFRLKDALQELLERHPDIAFVLIDCPPSLGLLTVNGLTAADGVIVPLQCEFFALEGISQLVKTIGRIKQGLNPDLLLQGIVLTMHDRRNNLSDLVAADARSFFGDRVYQTVIPRNIRISEAPSHGKPVLLYDYRSAGSQAYVALAGEILSQERRRNKAGALQ